MAPQFDEREHEEAAGHYRTAGWTLMLFGCGCLSVAAITRWIIPLELGFITPQGMGAIAGITVLIGAGMIQAGRE